MKIHFEIRDRDGSIVTSGVRTTDTNEIRSPAHADHVVRMLRVGNVILRIGQKLTVWVEKSPVVTFPDGAIDRAATAFHDALDAHIDCADEMRSRQGDWVHGSVEETAQALLLNDWTPSVHEQDDLDLSTDPISNEPLIDIRTGPTRPRASSETRD